jgi:putative transposase
VVAKALVVADGLHEAGRREILSIDVGEAETEAFWCDFLRGLVARGLVGVQLAISDAHAGLKAAIAKVLGCAWQRCTVHFLRDGLGHARKDQHGLLAALIRPIFNAASLAEARDRLSEAVAHLEGSLGKVATLLEDAEPDILAFYSFPADHWRKLRSTNPHERFNKEIGRRTDVVGIFPDDRSLIRLVGMLCIEQNECHEGRPGGRVTSGLPRTIGASVKAIRRRPVCSMSALIGALATRRSAPAARVERWRPRVSPRRTRTASPSW